MFVYYICVCLHISLFDEGKLFSKFFQAVTGTFLLGTVLIVHKRLIDASVPVQT